jgi:hypothetical protein
VSVPVEEVEVNLRPTVSRQVCPGVRHSSTTGYQFFFLFEISFRQLRLCYFVAPSLTRGRVCNLLYNYFWALPEQSLLGRSPAELRPYFTVSSETPPTWRARSPYLYPPGTGWPSYTPGQWVPLTNHTFHTSAMNKCSVGTGRLSPSHRVRSFFFGSSPSVKFHRTEIRMSLSLAELRNDKMFSVSLPVGML